MSAGLTTHVLDTSSEGPATGVDVTLHEVNADGTSTAIASGTTNTDGRLDEPLLTPDTMESGTYRLVFDVGEYFRETGSESTFLEKIPVQFIIDDPTEHYHVPLLLSPGGYTTYRGS